jgi:hypothetical protein
MSFSPIIACLTISSTPSPREFNRENADATATAVAADEPSPAPSGIDDAIDTLTLGLAENTLAMSSTIFPTGRNAGDPLANLSDDTSNLEDGPITTLILRGKAAARANDP